ncbi:hypothetical protein KCA24_35860, partial [Escherichia coli]|nr:hypothetical protein [Escherichia coli]
MPALQTYQPNIHEDFLPRLTLSARWYFKAGEWGFDLQWGTGDNSPPSLSSLLSFSPLFFCFFFLNPFLSP